MSKTCTWIPKKGKEVFNKLKQDLGYKDAALIFNKVRGDEFQNMFKDTLRFTSEGIPTYESIMNNPLVQKYIGEDRIIKRYKKDMPHYEDTRENNKVLLQLALDFNKENNGYTAYVDYDENGDLTLQVEKTTNEVKKIIQTQKNIQELNDKIIELLKSIGITIGDLSEIEIAAGRVGETNFTHIKDIADGFSRIIRVANNMEGDNAISEEFAHLIIGIFRDNPLVQRGLDYFKNQNNAKTVLKDQYDQVYEYYNGNESLIAEEALGQFLQESMINKNNEHTEKVPLLKRILNFILSPFKKIDIKQYNDEIFKIGKELNDFTSSILEGKTKITKQQIENAQRMASFNALSEKAQVQIDTLKKASERFYKLAYLTQNIEDRDKDTEKSKNRKFADAVAAELKENFKDEETMAAIASTLNLSYRQIDNFREQLQNLDNYSIEDKFIILRNVLYTLQAFDPIIKDLYEVTSREYLSDEHIDKQSFIIGTSESKIQDIETENSEVEQVDTSEMTIEQIKNKIEEDSKQWELDEEEKRYVNRTTGEKAGRVTSIIQADIDVTPFDENSPWVTPSTNIGTGIDELVRDFFEGRIEYNNNQWKVNGVPVEQVYPNSNKHDLNLFISQINKFKKELEDQGITIIPRDITVNGIIQSVDDAGKVHNINVAGTLDLIGYDKNGKWHIYDMKTHRSKLTESKKDKYAKQVTLYKQFLEQKYGIEIEDINIIPIKVSYPAPNGTQTGSAEYTVSNVKHEEYRGRTGNQLLIDGNAFDGAKPFLEDVITLNTNSLKLDYKELSGDKTGGLGSGREQTLKALDTVNRLYIELAKQFKHLALPEVIRFLKPIIGDSVKIKDKNGNLKEVDLQTLLEQAPLSDISWFTKMFTAMADSPDMLLQVFNRVYKRANAEHRINTISKVQEIMALGKEYEDLGITSYEWMFELDKHNYINHTVINGKDYSYDKSAYEKAKQKRIKELDLLYGESPEINSTEYKQKKEYLKQWIKDNTKVVHDNDTDTWIEIPNNEIYPSKYNSLTQTQKEFFDKWMGIKAELDMLLGPNKTTLTNTIKIRKTGIERAKDLLSGDIMSGIEELKTSIFKSYDDPIQYSSYSGIRGFNGEEIMNLPLHYVHNNGNDEDLSTDVIGTLAMYAEMAYNYDAMQQIVNPLEIARELTRDRNPQVTRKGLEVREKFTFAGVSINNPIYVDNSNIQDMLNSFFETKIYQRYLKDSGEILGADTNKMATLLLKLGSTVQLGFNNMAHLANAVTGIAMQNIEAIAGEYFSASELWKADQEFGKALGNYVGDIGQRINNSKLALFDELFDVKQNFKQRSKKSFLNKTILTRVFGPSLQFFGQEAGDFWLYNRTAIAVALKTKLKDSNGNSISLWDALETVPINSEKPHLGNKLVIKEGVTKEDGTEFTNKDIFEIGSYINGVNKHLFGIYNPEDMIMARSVIWGRFMMQYRDWIPSALVKRFRGKTWSLELNKEFEGYYRTSLRFTSQIIKELKNGQLNISQLWNELEDYERANVIRTVVELSQWIGVSIIAFLLGGGDDKDKKGFIEAMASYMAKREQTELGALVPFMMPKEMLKMVQSPAASTNVIKDIGELVTLLNPLSYTDEIQSGDYKGHSSAYRAFFRSPLTLWYRTIKRNLNPEKAETFYEK